MAAYKSKTKNTWECSFYYKDYQGTRKQKHKRGFKTKKTALEYEREFLLQSTFDITMTFESLYKLYMADLSHRLREHTMINKKYIIALRVLPFFRKITLDKITPIVVRKWQNELMSHINVKTNKVYSQTYIKTINNQLVAIFNYAIKYHNLKENPCHKAGTIGKKQAEEMSIWTLEEFNKFIIVVEHKPISYTGFNVLFWTGLRIGEMLALTLKDIDFKNKTIKINKSYQRLKKKDVITEPKTPRSNRVIGMTDKLTKILKDYIGMMYNPEEDERLFKSTKYLFEHDMRTYSIKAEVKKIRLHDLRHSHASLLINTGANVLAISQRLGHEKVETTLNTYSHLYPSSNDSMIEMLNKV